MVVSIGFIGNIVKNKLNFKIFITLILFGSFLIYMYVPLLSPFLLMTPGSYVFHRSLLRYSAL